MSTTPVEFLHQYQLNGDKTGVRLSSNAVGSVSHADATIWQHVDLKHPLTKPWLRGGASIDKAISQSLAAEETRPRSLITPKGVLVVLRGVNFNPGENPEDMVSIRLWIEPHRVLSARLRSLLSIQDIVNGIETDQAPRSSGEFLTMLVELLANRIGDYVNRLEDELAEIDEGMEKMRLETMRTRLRSLRHQIAAVRRFLAPQRDAMDRLYMEETEIFNERDRQRLRDESDRFSRYLEDLDLAREQAMLLQEAFASHIAQEQNDRMYVLSIVAAIFLPLTFVTGLLGMNVGGLPLLENTHGFVIASVVMVAATALLTLFFKFKKWF